jgi:hypothetical protein
MTISENDLSYTAEEMYQVTLSSKEDFLGNTLTYIYKLAKAGKYSAEFEGGAWVETDNEVIKYVVEKLRELGYIVYVNSSYTTIYWRTQKSVMYF